MKLLLNQIRAKEKPSLKEIVTGIFLCLFLGVFFGAIAKHFDSISIIGDITTRIGIWVLIATLLAAWSSKSPEAAAANVFGFFAGMLATYYAYSTLLFGFLPRYYFYAWGTFALLSPIGAYVVWYSRGEGWVAAICAALPIGLLLAQGYPFYYTYSVLHGFDLLAAIILVAVLPVTNAQRLRLLPVSIAVFLIVYRLDLISLIFGGL